jgi:hypothetical protein
MMIHWSNRDQHRVKVLLDTGCTTTLISKTLVKKKNIPCQLHENEIAIRNFTGELLPGAGQKYTEPMLLRHRNHYTQETFEVTPLEPKVDIFLPFWWIVKHTPQGAWDHPEVRCSSPGYLKECTKTATTGFALSLDHSIRSHPKAQIIG